MPHRIGRHEDIASALLRLAADDLSAARRALQDDRLSDRTIHRVRQRLKRVRSVLRILRPAFGGRPRKCSRHIRDAARLLSGARDAAAAASMAWQISASGAANDAGFDRIAALLDREARANRLTSVDHVIASIARSEKYLASLCNDFNGRALLSRAFVRAYRRGLSARRRAERSLETSDLHAWRKDVKDLWHLLRLARKRVPRRALALIPELERLSELLGLDNDHAVLAEKLAAAPAGNPAREYQLSLIAGRRRALQADAFRLGADLYRRRPRAFRKRIAPG